MLVPAFQQRYVREVMAQAIASFAFRAGSTSLQRFSPTVHPARTALEPPP
jgi:hypothetical protein